MDLSEALAIPYLLLVESVDRDELGWRRRVSYPELPGCEVEMIHLEAAIDQADALRLKWLVAAIDRGETPPVPRPPLRIAPAIEPRV